MEELINKELKKQHYGPLNAREKIIVKVLIKHLTKFIDCKE